jgi:hypothetical protein
MTAVAVVLFAPAPPGEAAPTRSACATQTGAVEMKLTVAARVCPTYTDVRANRARNNIQESLRDLGLDSLYTAGQAIDPDLEAQGQPNCRPLPNWTFTLGTGIGGMRADERWGSLSYVSGAFATPIVTQGSTPLLGPQGQETGRDLAGAVTITLTPTQASLAATSSSLWIQGGTVTDPVLQNQFPDQYGFAALRCSVDNLNGDNVEWITFPAGSTHVFCFAYYVQPPPRSGTITVVKHVSDPPNATQTFPFRGNLSFNPGGVFSLTVRNGANDSFTQVRAETRPGDPLWSFTEDVPDGWHVQDISCVSQTGGSVTTASIATGTATVNLAAGDHVTCTYTDSLTPPPPGTLHITKTTLGGVGTFGYTVTPVGGGSAVEATATTTTLGTRSCGARHAGAPERSVLDRRAASLLEPRDLGTREHHVQRRVAPGGQQRHDHDRAR